MKVRDLKIGQRFTYNGILSGVFIGEGIVSGLRKRFCSLHDGESHISYFNSGDTEVQTEKLVYGDLEPGDKFRLRSGGKTFTKLIEGVVDMENFEYLGEYYEGTPIEVQD